MELAEKTTRGRWVQLVLVPVLFYAGAKLSLIFFAVTPEVLVMLWIPNSILLATLLHYRGRRFGYFAVTVILAEIAADFHTFPLAQSVLFGMVNMLEVSVAYLLLRRWRFHEQFTAPRDIACFVVAGPVISAFLSAVGASTVYRIFEPAETDFLEVLRVWWFSDALGLLILTPLMLSFRPAVAETSYEGNRMHWYDIVAIIAGLVVLIAFSLAHERVIYGVTVRSFLLIPPILYIAARSSVRTTTAAVAVVAAVILYITKNGQQPFGDLPIRETVINAQEFIFVLSTMTLGIAALLSQLRTNAYELETRVQQRTAELSEANKQLEYLAVTDTLTGIFNRRALFYLFDREVERHKRHLRPLTLILLDIDHFKLVNDEYGHEAGDAVLQMVADICSKTVRRADIFARYGGEEFVVIAPETNQANAVNLAERIRSALRTAEFAVESHQLHMTASFGIATMQKGVGDAQDLFRRADHALYAAKAAGRDTIVTDAS